MMVVERHGLNRPLPRVGVRALAELQEMMRNTRALRKPNRRGKFASRFLARALLVLVQRRCADALAGLNAGVLREVALDCLMYQREEGRTPAGEVWE